MPEMVPVIVCDMTGKLSKSIVNKTHSNIVQRLFEVDMGKLSFGKLCIGTHPLRLQTLALILFASELPVMAAKQPDYFFNY